MKVGREGIVLAALLDALHRKAKVYMVYDIGDKSLDIASVKLKSGEEKRLAAGVYYHKDTSGEVIRALTAAREKKLRVRLFYGYSGWEPTVKAAPEKLGLCWMDEYDTIGTIGASMGPVKVPLLIASSRSSGGPAILEHCVIRIDVNIDGEKKTVYQHKAFHMPTVEARDNGEDASILRHEVYVDGKLYGGCNSAESAKRLAAFLSGERWSK
mgnify:CR=1 FL=1